MNKSILPVTVSSEYKNISLLLLALTRGAILENSFRFLALSAFGSLYSADPKAVEVWLDSLESHLLAVSAESELIADDVEAVGFAAHVLIQVGRWDAKLQQHQSELMSYFDKVASLQWLRSSQVAMSFLLGFGKEKIFHKLAENATAYLEQQLPNTNTSPNNFPVILFGLYMGGAAPQINEMQIQHWLDRTHQPFYHLCMLVIVLKAWQHRLATEAIRQLQEKVAAVYAEIVNKNVGLVGVILSVIHLAEMGQNGDQIVETLKRLQLNNAAYEQISAVITGASQLFVQFEIDPSTQLPIVENLAFYLFAACQLGLTEAYIIDEHLKTQFFEFSRLRNNRQFKAVNRVELAVLIVIAFIVGVFIIFEVWWPLSDTAYNWALINIENQLGWGIFDDFLKALILVPVYFVFGATLTLWLHGQIQWGDTIKPDRVMENVSVLAKQILGKRRE